jgi:hypothetical protein
MRGRFPQEVAPDFDPIQLILYPNVSPRPNGLLITFTTAKGSIPVVTLWKSITGNPDEDMVARNLVATGWGLVSGIRTNHACLFENLDQERVYWFKIYAGNDEQRILVGPHPPAEYQDTAGTLKRECTIRFFSLEVLATGGSGSGDTMDFGMGIYNGSNITNDLLIVPKHLTNDSVDSGAIFQKPFGDPIAITNAPDVVVLYVQGVYEDVSFFTGEIGDIGTRVPETMPSSPSHGSDDGGAWADGSTPLTLPYAPGTTHAGGSWVLGTGLMRDTPVFDVTGDVETTVLDTKGVLQQWPKTFRRKRFFPSEMLPIVSGGIPRRMQVRNRLVSFRLGPAGDVYMGLGRSGHETWRSLGQRNIDFLTGTAHENETMTLLTRNLAGELSAASIRTIDAAHVDWIGLNFITRVLPKLVRRRNGEIIFLALNLNGILHAAPLRDGKGTPEWTALGGPFKAPVTATENSGGNLFVAAQDEKGELLYGLLDESRPEWHHVEAPVEMLLSARESPDKSMRVYGIDKNRVVHCYIVGSSRWEPLGTPEHLINSAELLGKESQFNNNLVTNLLNNREKHGKGGNRLGTNVKKRKHRG